MAYELAAFSIEYLDAEGMYMAPGERSDVFMAVMSPCIVSRAYEKYR